MKTRIPQGLLLASLVATAAAGCSLLAHAQGPAPYPARPLRIITGFVVGGVSDIIARTVGEQVGRQLGQQVLIDTKPGAGGMLAMEIAAAASPDGYTLHLATSIMALGPLFTERKVSFDPLKAFAPVARLGTGPTVLAVTPKLPVRSVKDLVELGRSRPEPLLVGHSGDGSIQHLAGEFFRVMSGVKLTPIAYRSGQASLTAALQGEVEATFAPLSSALAHMEAGRLRALGVTGAVRAKAAPDIPAIAEFLPGFNIASWYGLVVPAATPGPVIARLNEETRKALQAPALLDILERQGIEVQYSTAAEFGRLMSDDRQRWSRLVKEAGVVLR